MIITQIYGPVCAPINPNLQIQPTGGRNGAAQNAQKTKTIVHYHDMFKVCILHAAALHLYALFSLSFIFSKLNFSGSKKLYNNSKNEN